MNLALMHFVLDYVFICFSLSFSFFKVFWDFLLELETVLLNDW